MGSENLAPETPPSKGISSRLLTMKFMQRAAAAESAASTPSPKDSASSKRRKTDSPLTGDFHSFDEAAIQAAIEQQQATRQAALAKHNTELADTHWVLDGFEDSHGNKTESQPLRNVEYVGFAQIDATDGQEAQGEKAKDGRQKVGNYKSRDDAKYNSPGTSDSDDDSSDDSSSDGRAGSPGRSGRKTSTASATRSASSSRKKGSEKHAAEALRARDFSDKRKKSQVNLNKLTSISGASPSISSGGGSRSGNFSCYSCGKPGHKAPECPGRKGRDGGKSKKLT